jgi:diacylglycerol kinase family enzyme
LALGRGAIRAIDLAKVGNRCSVLRVSTGFEAETAFAVTREAKDKLGISPMHFLACVLCARQTRRIYDFTRRSAADFMSRVF